MSEEQILNFAILGVAVLFALLGLWLLIGAYFGRTRTVRYEIQRLQARHSASAQAFKGVGLLAVSTILFAIWGFFRFGLTEQAIEIPLPPATVELIATELAPTLAAPTAQATEPVAPTQTASPTKLPTLPVIDTPAEAATVEPEVAVTVIVTATSTPAATAIPYDAVVDVVGGLNMRDTPNGLVSVLLPNGSGLTLLNEAIAAGDYLWQKVESAEGEQGWVAEEFIKYVGQ